MTVRWNASENEPHEDPYCPTVIRTTTKGVTETTLGVLHDWRCIHFAQREILWYCTRCQSAYTEQAG